jgi:hypothetical protein
MSHHMGEGGGVRPNFNKLNKGEEWVKNQSKNE